MRVLGFYIQRCCERLKTSLKWICCGICCCCSNKVSAEATTRVISIGATDELSKKKHNRIKTSKYTLLTFLPKNLSEQFRRVVNFYFLMVTVIAVLIDSPVSPMTSIAPLTFMVLVTAVKQGYEDWLRHKADNAVNNQLVEIIHKGVIKEVRNSSISPGTMVRVKRGAAVPADLVLLCCAGNQGKCNVTTANLDGETNLKTLRVPPPLFGYTPDMLPRGMTVEIGAPIADLYTFCGRLRVAEGVGAALQPDCLLLRGARLKHTEWALGAAVYTGEETKLALNSKYSGNKFSSTELAVNGYLIFFIGLLIVEIFGCLAAKLVLDWNDNAHDLYLGPGTERPLPLSSVMQDLFSFLLLYYYIIPMSLYVTIEMYKFIGALFIGWDEDLRCPETGRPAVANTSDLNEELGQVEILFSDKTGTLTKNLMVFKACSINRQLYEEIEKKLYDIEDSEMPVDYTKIDVKFFFTVLALCHSVQISNEDMTKLSAKLSLSGDKRLKNFFKRKKMKNVATTNSNGELNENNNVSTLLGDAAGQMEYQASSPDEKALVEAAARVGITFLGEDGNNLLLQVGDETEMYERLQIIEFTSERKRMSVIVRDKNGKIWLFCKGAESAVFPLCTSGDVDHTDHNVTSFARRGLRTLAVAYREVPTQEYTQIADAIKNMEVNNIENLQSATQQFRLLEKQLTLVGATAVEDCLQDDVADTLASLRRAGLKIWVLTGDKVETAISVAQSCAHISDNDRRMFLAGIEDQTALDAQLEECKNISKEPSYKELTLIVDGASMSLILASPQSSKMFVDISMKCAATLACRLSPIQKAEIVKLIKGSGSLPITAAIGDGANDISMLQEAHVSFGIFGKEGHQAARCADFAFTQFSMIRKMLLVQGHWYYQRLATLILYFFYKNLILGNLMLLFQVHSAFSTQSVFDSMYLSFYNLFFTAVPCLLLATTDQCWSKEKLLRNPTLYRGISRNQLLSWQAFSWWCLAAVAHSLIIYFGTCFYIRNNVLTADGTTTDLWSFGAVLFHLMVIVVNLKIILQARYQTRIFLVTTIGSIVLYIIFNVVYSLFNFQLDGDVLGTYTRLLSSMSFYCVNFLIIVACLAPDLILKMLSEQWSKRQLDNHNSTTPSIFSVSKL